jgi:hypothetical protein
MLKEDRNVLALLIKEYGAKEVVQELAFVLSDRADEASDLGLKEQAIASASTAWALQDLCNIIDV